MLDDQRRKIGRRRQLPGTTFTGLGQVIKIPKQNTIIKDRLVEAADLLTGSEQEIAFQHSLFCQTSLPYRNPGPDVRRWERCQGRVKLEIEAGRALHPDSGKFEDVPLPYGPKARLILMHLNSMAVRTQSARIDVGDSLTDFVKRMGVDPNGRNIKIIREQVTALSSALIRLGVIQDNRATQLDAKIVDGFELWLPKDDQQRVLWTCSVDLNLRYFESLLRHAVPLEERAIAAFSDSAMALDIYTWLAQRLHRIHKSQRQLVPWTSLKEQFGPDFQRIRKFRETFMDALRQVHVVYPAAKIEVHGRGLFLHASPPPVVKTGVLMRLPDKTR